MTRRQGQGMFAEARRLTEKGRARFPAMFFVAYLLFMVSVIGTASLFAAGLYDIAAVDMRQPGRTGSSIVEAIDLYSDPPAFWSCIYPCVVNPLDELRSGFYQHGDTRGHFTMRSSRGLFAGGPDCQGPGCVFCKLEVARIRPL